MPSSARAGKVVGWFGRLAEQKQWLTEFDRVAVADQNLLDDAIGIRFDFVEQFHRFDDADGLAFFGRVAGRCECLCGRS